MNFPRISFLFSSVSVCLSLLSGHVHAQEAPPDDLGRASHYDEADFADIPYRESDLGIDYRALADFPVSHMLSWGEVEWMQNAPADYGDEAADLWKRGTAAYIGWGRPSELIVEDMRAYTPNMLLNFDRLDANDEKYGYIEVLGSNFVLDRFMDKNGIAASE